MSTPKSKWAFNKPFKTLTLKNQKPITQNTKPTSETHQKDLLLHQVFNYFDGDKDGKISIAELQSCIQSIGDTMTHEEAKWVVADFDGDGDGMLDIEDFTRLMSERESKDDEIDDDLKRAFEMFEAEKGSGCITPKSLQRALNRLGESKSCEECAAMIRAFDLDHNGVLDFQEFHQMMA
ncbi:hypothetical protein Scep_020708 [Stephania cephalantha]|uniref:EF-hand domain-containing protein n=1 Tax=Stephania cephalantha TaxID=152367 RepID=A0AAP0ID23_9MAGN